MPPPTPDPDYARLAFGADARHVPAWLYVQHCGEGLVSFVGSSHTPTHLHHPLRYGSGRAHQLIVGELIVRPHLVVATDNLRGQGLGNLATLDHNIQDMLRDQGGEVLIAAHTLHTYIR